MSFSWSPSCKVIDMGPINWPLRFIRKDGRPFSCFCAQAVHKVTCDECLCAQEDRTSITFSYPFERGKNSFRQLSKPRLKSQRPISMLVTLSTQIMQRKSSLHGSSTFVVIGRRTWQVGR